MSEDRLSAGALASLGRLSEAADALLAVPVTQWGAPGSNEDAPGGSHLATLVGYLDGAARPLTELAVAVPTEHVTLFMAHLLSLPADTAGRVLDAFLTHKREATVTVLATAAMVAPRMHLEGALLWSVRLREHGLPGKCPLVAIAGDAALTPAERARAAAAGYRLFSDARLVAALPEILAAAPDAERPTVLAEIEALSGGLLTPGGLARAAEEALLDMPGTTPRRPAASIVILAWNAWEHTKKCLESLRRSLTPGDQVIVVDNGSTDGTAAGLASFPWVDVISNPENRGFAGGCNDGEPRVATREIVVFLNNDTVVPSSWLTTLLAPFSDPLVAATGPRSNGVSGSQLLQPVPYGSPLLPEFERFADAWAAWHAGQTTLVQRLVGFCLAVWRDAFVAVDGFDERYVGGGFEDDDLCHKLTGLGRTLQIAHACFVHHDAHSSFNANDLDWFALQCVNQQRFEEKWCTDRTSVGAPE